MRPLRQRLGFLSLTLAALVVVAVALVTVMIREGAANRRFERDVAEIAQRAGYAPFGATEGLFLSFRSADSYLRIVRGHGFHITLLLIPGRRQWATEAEWVDDDLLRQVLLEEEGDPTGTSRVWSDRKAFVGFGKRNP